MYLHGPMDKAGTIAQAYDHSGYKSFSVPVVYVHTHIIGTPHTVVQSHDAEQDDELTVDRGETVTVIWAADDGWWMVR